MRTFNRVAAEDERVFRVHVGEFSGSKRKPGGGCITIFVDKSDGPVTAKGLAARVQALLEEHGIRDISPARPGLAGERPTRSPLLTARDR